MVQLLRWLLIIISAGFFIVSDSLSANWGKTGNMSSLILVCLIAPVGYFFFGLLNRNNSLSVSSGLVNMILIIGTIFMGIFYFKDDITPRQKLGLIFAVTAVVLMI